jgi:formate/nitrite transporter FocA (FNT family)
MGPQTGMNCKIMICLAMFMAFLAAPGLAQTPP